MANSFIVYLDTTAPSSPTITINGGATYATNQLVTLSIGTSDSDTNGYQILLWGSVDNAHDTNIQATEATSKWVSFNNSKQIKLSDGDGNKQIFLKIRDDVHNVSAQVSDSITLDLSKPTINTSNPDTNKVSKQPNKNTFSFTFTVDKDFIEYKVKTVGSANAAENTGATIGTANGSTNTSGTGTFPKGTPITVLINASDLEISSAGDGEKHIKVFCRDQTKWSA